MEKIIEVMDGILTNVEEAHEKIEQAFRLKERCPHYAEWVDGMAGTHISFDTKGIETMERMLDTRHKEGRHDPNFDAFFQMWKGHAMKKTAKIKNMIDAFQR